MIESLIALISIAIVTTGAFYLLDRQARQFHAAYDHQIDEYERQREEWGRERRELLNRIQAPKLAAYQATGEPSDELLYVPFDDDKAHDDYVEARAAGEVT